MKPKITPAQLRLLRWHAEGRIDYPPRGKIVPLQRAGYMAPGWDRTITSAGLALLASTPAPELPERDRPLVPMKKSPAQLDREIAAAVTEDRPSARRRK